MDWCGGQSRDMVVIWYGEFWQNNGKYWCKIDKTAQFMSKAIDYYCNDKWYIESSYNRQGCINMSLSVFC